jgi:flagellar protein FlgJ
MTDFSPTLPPSLPPAPAQPTAIRRSAEALETAFLAEMLKSAGVYKPSESMGGGEGEEQFTSFLADAQARAMVARGGIGLSDQIERSLLARQQGGGA